MPPRTISANQCPVCLQPFSSVGYRRSHQTQTGHHTPPDASDDASVTDASPEATSPATTASSDPTDQHSPIVVDGLLSGSPSFNVTSSIEEDSDHDGTGTLDPLVSGDQDITENNSVGEGGIESLRGKTDTGKLLTRIETLL